MTPKSSGKLPPSVGSLTVYPPVRVRQRVERVRSPDALRRAIYTPGSERLPMSGTERPQVHVVHVVPLAGLAHAFEARQRAQRPVQPGARLDNHVIHLVAAQDLDLPREGGAPEELPDVERALRHLYAAGRPSLEFWQDLQHQVPPAADHVRLGGVGGDADALEVR